jgi:hypothetical protein
MNKPKVEKDGKVEEEKSAEEVVQSVSSSQKSGE